MNPHDNALQIAISQGGVIRLDQILECGIGSSTINRRVKTGSWQRIGRAVYRVIDMDGPLERVRAAIATLPQAVASHETAAELHAIPRLQTGKAVVTVHSKTTHSFPGVVVHRTRDLASDHTTTINGLRATTVGRTIVDLSATLHPRHIEDIVDDLVALNRLDLEVFANLVGSVARRGKPGSSALRKIVAQRNANGTPVASRLERFGLAVLMDAGLPRPKTEYPAPWDETKRLDVAYPHARVGIEWDSRRWHTRADAFQRDRMRDRQALLHDWRIFRFTWVDVTERPHDVVTTIRTALRLPHFSS